MTCPRCSVALKCRNVQGADVHLCESCGGLFLYHGELNKVAGPSVGDIEYSTLDQESFRHDDTYGLISCLGCGHGEMSKVEFIIYTNIILDYCSGCRAFWLDGRELKKINTEVKKLNETPGGPEPPMLWFLRFIWSLPQ